MIERPEVLIVGAGPTGLASALFLADRGVRVRVVDKAPLPTTTSRAQVVNPRSLELLAKTGVTERILAEGRVVTAVKFYEEWAPVAEIDYRELPSPYRLTVLPQARTEAILAVALAARGVVPERSLAFETLVQDEANVMASLKRADGGVVTVTVPLLLAADGAHSRVREALNVPFEGHVFPEPWPLFDVELDCPLDLDSAHISLVHGGLVFMLAIRPGLWRVFGDVDNVLERVPPGSVVGKVAWESSFHIADKLAGSHAVGRVALAGDAAHIHSPVGARGMNLGIEDAWVYAACAEGALNGNTSRIDDYARLRRPIHARIVGRMDRLTALARGPRWVGMLRNTLLPAVAGFGPAARMMRDFVSGLDHDVTVDG